MLTSPGGAGEMQAGDLETMLGEMIDCGREYERRVLAGERYPFANLDNALREIHRGTHRPYPCGAGAGYLGVSADGELSACHRFVGDEEGAMGSLAKGIDRDRQAEWLETRHVHRQEPCRSCWARYLCGGGCHHEVIHRGRPACDYIRGWLHYCIEAYLRLSRGAAGVMFDGQWDEHGLQSSAVGRPAAPLRRAWPSSATMSCCSSVSAFRAGDWASR